MRERTACYGALYLRLSKEDGNTESASIENQRNLLRRYAEQHHMPIVAEFVDDGWSGTNFNRPGFRRMIAEIEAGRVNLVLVKDLSRLGRDYIGTGQYTEQYFPSKGVRCIAVNDGYDSLQGSTDLIPFRNVLNELYARDISRKIRSAFQTKMQSGCYIGAFAPYGYRKSANNKNQLVEDPAAGRVVQRIFALASAGARPGEIARRLNGEGVLSPLAYRRARRGEREEDEQPRWTGTGVAKLLHNPVYLGCMVQGKTEKVSFKSTQSLRRPPEDWVVVPHTHVPLIEENVFLLVQRQMQHRTSAKESGFHNLFSGIAQCADCGSRMSTAGSRKKDALANLVCGSYKLYGKDACTNHFVDYETLCDLVLQSLQRALPVKEKCKEILDITLDRFFACVQLGRETEQAVWRKKAGQIWDATFPLQNLPGDLALHLIRSISVGQGRYEKAEGKRVKRQRIDIVFCFQVKHMVYEYVR